VILVILDPPRHLRHQAHRQPKPSNFWHFRQVHTSGVEEVASVLIETPKQVTKVVTISTLAATDRPAACPTDVHSRPCTGSLGTFT
jgi:hypothetical protein